MIVALMHTLHRFKPCFGGGELASSVLGAEFDKYVTRNAAYACMHCMMWACFYHRQHVTD